MTGGLMRGITRYLLIGSSSVAILVAAGAGEAKAQDVKQLEAQMQAMQAQMRDLQRQVAEAKEALAGSTVKVASVATGFPSGQTFRDIKLAEVRAAVDAGADFIKSSTGKVEQAATLTATLVMLEAILDFERAGSNG